ncbi:hypothetical protein ARMGADRAFT_686954 [Armillaria gallica]|uniref:Uncharacterized protein n=1 Tax=Armillaria gallica TaxID=47427 RepID=A0A2H3CWK2_ARMGA|nr:hypothetical protein ARMGADRAFT_686954 [Armillaria gallica]
MAMKPRAFLANYASSVSYRKLGSLWKTCPVTSQGQIAVPCKPTCLFHVVTRRRVFLASFLTSGSHLASLWEEMVPHGPSSEEFEFHNSTEPAKIFFPAILAWVCRAWSTLDTTCRCDTGLSKIRKPSVSVPTSPAVRQLFSQIMCEGVPQDKDEESGNVLSFQFETDFRNSLRTCWCYLVVQTRGSSMLSLSHTIMGTPHLC